MIQFNLYLQSAIVADQCLVETFVYLTQAFFEESETKNQLDMLSRIINTLVSLANLSKNNFDTLSTKTCQYSAKLLKKTDQALATVMCFHLFYPAAIANPSVSNVEKSAECLEWSLKIVNTCMPDKQIPLLVEILNTYVYHFFSNNTRVDMNFVNKIIEMIDKGIVEYAAPVLEEGQKESMMIF